MRGVRIALPTGKEMDLIKFQSHFQPFETACESEAGPPVCLLPKDAASHSAPLPHLLIILLFIGISVYPMGRPKTTEDWKQIILNFFPERFIFEHRIQ